MAALRHARVMYRRLSETLLGELDRIGEGLTTEEACKRTLALIVVHQKALQTVVEFEKSLEKQIAERIGRRRGDIDVEAARREILGRLASLSGEE